MSFLNRHFFSGCAAGIVFSVVVILVGLFLFIQSMKGGMGLGDGAYPPPDIPLVKVVSLDWNVKGLLSR